MKMRVKSINRELVVWMSRVLFLIAAFNLIPSPKLFAQNAVVAFAYFDKDWKEVQNIERAHYYRTVDESGKWYLVRDYFAASNALQMEAVCSGVIPQLIMQGKVTWYYENGQIKREASFKDNVPVGLSKTYHQDGSPQSVELIRDKKNLRCQYWAEDGQPLLVRGTGVIAEERDDLSLTFYTEVVDSVTVASYAVSAYEKDTVYTISEHAADYQGGFKKLYQGIASTIKYPKEARRNGIEGRVFIEFVINKSGGMESVKVVKGLGGGCDEEAVRSLSLQTGWIPAKHKGKPVKARMVLPITFRLG